MNQSQNSYSLKNFLWCTWLRQSTRCKTLHLQCLRADAIRADAIDREEKTRKTHDKRFLEENENKMVNISIYFYLFIYLEQMVNISI